MHPTLVFSFRLLIKKLLHTTGLYGLEKVQVEELEHRLVLVSYPTLSTGCYFIRHIPGSGKD